MVSRGFEWSRLEYLDGLEEPPKTDKRRSVFTAYMNGKALKAMLKETGCSRGSVPGYPPYPGSGAQTAALCGLGNLPEKDTRFVKQTTQEVTYRGNWTTSRNWATSSTRSRW